MEASRKAAGYLQAAGLAFGILLASLNGSIVAQPTSATLVAHRADTSTDFLSDDAWRSLSREERRARSRRSMVARYEPSGQPSVDRLAQYVEKFGTLTVYDPRHYHYKVQATHVPGTTGSVVLNGEVYPPHYKHGVQDTLQSLGFNIIENHIAVLPDAGTAAEPYGVSTTSAATLRKEPRRNAEQVNSIGMGGWIRVLRTGTLSDVSTGSASGRRAPGAEALALDSPEDWVLAQTMEGYLGFARKADFSMQTEYQLPDGIVRLPVDLNDNLTVPAGAFVYSEGASGWKLHSGQKLPDSARVTDLRPDYTAEEIIELMKPFMETRYVWGGVTDEGIDCSGFSQFFMRTSGVMIPRDAVQQATGGLIVAWGDEIVEKAKPGDLIFFATDTGRISHVAISLGGSKVIHSAGKGVHIADLNTPRDEESDETYGGRALFARRMVAR